jgi:phospholipase/carboxylesterase
MSRCSALWQHAAVTRTRVIAALLAEFVCSAAGGASTGAVAPAPNDGKAFLTARPGASVLTLPRGETHFEDGATAYRPAALPTGPRPLLVILHGYPQDPRRFIKAFEPWADRCGALLLAPAAKNDTWDIIAAWLDLRDRRTGPARTPVLFGPDVRRIDSDLARLFAAAPVDPRQITLLGFSDGASYALSLGLANPQLFRWIVALSPGFAVFPERGTLAQKIFIAHGTRDSRLEFERTRDGIVKPLREAGMDVTFRPFDGDHVFVPVLAREALQLAFGCSRSAGT